MVDLCAVEDLPSWLQRAQVDTETAERLIAAASDAVRAEVGQTITEVVDDTVALWGTGGRLLALPELPVISVTSVTIDDGTASTVLTTDTGYRLIKASGLLWRKNGVWACDEEVTVVYSHGYEAVPQAAKTVAIELACSVYANPEGVSQDGVDGVVRVFPQTALPGRVGLTIDQKRRLDRRRARVM